MYFANILENGDDHFEVANVKSGQCQPDMAKVTIALLQSFTAGLAESCLVRNTHSGIKRSICGDGPFFLEVVESTITDF